MKRNIFIIFLILSFPVFALKVVRHPTKLNYKKYQCKQKILPLSVEFEVLENRVFIKLVAENEIKDFKVSSLRGLDGLKVSMGSVPATRNMSKGSQVIFDSSFTRPEGLSYLVVDLEGKIGTVVRKQSIPFPIGQVTQQQKNVNFLKSNKTDNTENFNVMKLDSE